MSPLTLVDDRPPVIIIVFSARYTQAGLATHVKVSKNEVKQTLK